MKLKQISLAVFLLLALGACKKADQTSSAPVSGDKIGIAACDEYIEKYQKCMNEKVPESGREMMKSSFEMVVKTWKEAAQSPDGRASLEVACKTAVDTAKQALGNYGCSW